MLVAASANTSLADVAVDELQDEITTLASHIYAGTCRWLELVGELDRRGSWAEWVAAPAPSGSPGAAR